MRIGPLIGALAIAACAPRPIDPPRRAPIPSHPAVAPPASAEAPPAPRKSALEIEVERLRLISVRVRMPDLTSDDADRIEKIGEAIEGANAGMFVRYVSHGAETRLAYGEELFDGGHACLRDAESERRKTTERLARYGAQSMICYASGSPMYLGVMGSLPPLPSGMPGLVWEVEDRLAIFVSLDGGSYGIRLDGSDPRPTLEPGAGPPASWPAPASDVAFGRQAMSTGKRVQTRDLEKVDASFGACAEKAWTRAHKRFEGGRFTKDPEMESWIAGGLEEDQVMQLALRRACKKDIQAWEAVFVAMIEERVAARRALFERAKARVVAIGADR